MLRATFAFSLIFVIVSVTEFSFGQQPFSYSGPSDTNHSIDPAIARNDSRIVEWADQIDPSRTHFAPRGSTSINQTGGFNSLGDLNAAEIAAGVAPGFLTVTFPTGIRNGNGADFVVFENGFLTGRPNVNGVVGLFAEFAYVDVSTNGIDFARFPSISLNDGPLDATFGAAFASYDVTNVYNLAGKHASGFGTPFNLDDLLDHEYVLSGAVDLENIQYVRLFDIPGNGSFTDSLGNPIYDNWLTVGSGGFDFILGNATIGMNGGVGVINVAAVPEPSSLCMVALLACVGRFYSRRRNRS